MLTKSILFVCLGNICRSPMAEAVFQRIVAEKGLTSKFEIDSAGMLAFHKGELADSRMRYFASKRGYKLTHRSRPFASTDFDNFDMIIGMDDQNIASLEALAMSEEESNKIYRMTDFCVQKHATHVPDPYYGGDQGFENVIDLLEDACSGLFIHLQSQNKQEI